MLEYMEYLEQCFAKNSQWDYNNLYEHVLDSSASILQFRIPRGFKFSVSSSSSPYNYNSISFENRGKGRLNGSLAYFYTTQELLNYKTSKNIPLQDVIDSYRLVNIPKNDRSCTYNEEAKRPWLLYGRMYLPSQSMEAMAIKRLTANTQLMLKGVNILNPTPTPFKNKLTSLSFYLQSNYYKWSREAIFLSNDALFGLRFLYNFGNSTNPQCKPSIDSNNISTLSLGTELWYGAMNMTPGLSTTLRYTSFSVTGNPLTFTLACNPILGSVSTTYSIKTNVFTTLCSKFDFNFYSYESDLTIGCDLWRFGNNADVPDSNPIPLPSKERELFIPLHDHQLVFPEQEKTKTISNEPKDYESDLLLKFLEIQGIKTARQSVATINNFTQKIKNAPFTSALKLNTSLKNHTANLMWEGKYNDFLLSTGCSLNLDLKSPSVDGFGLQVQYSS
ncbi:BA75_01292T0 [Komagataella pastoris]|uniref:Mitochondrial distribution and morphology protein 10 n=1 Tax=Komagataella pastoris TaxID=4922 RepID=A0A1B2J7T7_PICPA|nr:BA75_01292T0 [Komagataella pastoris]